MRTGSSRENVKHGVDIVNGVLCLGVIRDLFKTLFAHECSAHADIYAALVPPEVVDAASRFVVCGSDAELPQNQEGGKIHQAV
jgi:hypothetical protein